MMTPSTDSLDQSSRSSSPPNPLVPHPATDHKSDQEQEKDHLRPIQLVGARLLCRTNVPKRQETDYAPAKHARCLAHGTPFTLTSVLLYPIPKAKVKFKIILIS